VRLALAVAAAALLVVSGLFLVSASSVDRTERASQGEAPAGAGATGGGCGPVEEPPATKKDYGRVEEQSGPSAGPALQDVGEAVTRDEARALGYRALTPKDPKGRTEILRRMLPPAYATFLSREPIGASTTLTKLIASGGAIIIERPTEPGPTIVERASAWLKAGAVPVKIGDYDGVISHGDEIASGVRPFGLWWTDGEHDWSIRAGFDDGRDVIELARSMVCD
jgi:hypothetical protein